LERENAKGICILRTIHIIDTTVYLEILKVPKHIDENRYPQTISQFEEFCNRGDTLLLPFGTIAEAGNHIADAVDGRRYGLIKKFVEDIIKAIRDETPYKVCGIPKGSTGLEDIQRWIIQYKNLAVSGVGMVDTMCIDVFNKMRLTFPNTRVRIWHYNHRHLEGYDTHPEC